MFRLIAIVLLALVIVLPASAQQSRPVPSGPQSHPIAASDAYSRARSKQTLLIDTREDYEKSAGVPDGVGASVTYLMNGSTDQQFIAEVLKAVGGNRDADVTLICTTGIRSSAAERLLAANGFTNAHTITGGFTGWVNSGLPKK